ncbi:MAG: radical SAM protein [Flavobacteriaceae bacterium]|nr:radical SAM protein [Flavobacteriaceae bacterium]
MNKIYTIDWRITGLCNERCPFCYGPEKHIHPPIDIINKITSAICNSNFNVVRFSGGEPLLISNLSEVIKRLNTKKIKVVLSTNGFSYLKKKNDFEPNISKLNLSLDGYDQKSHSINGRSKKSFTDIINILEYYNSFSKNLFSIKIGTIITSKNISVKFLLKMYYFLKQYSIIDRWKIYQYVPEGPIIDMNLSVNDDSFNELESTFFKAIKPSSDRNDFTIKFSSILQRTQAYLIIQPYGKVFIPIHNGNYTKEVYLGNILEDNITTIINNWFKKGGDRKKHLNNNSILNNE